jgi:GntR family transcriptional regulator
MLLHPYNSTDPKGPKDPMTDKFSPVSLYFQVARQIRQDILDGKYQPHEKLPGEFELAENFNVSRVTIRSALEILKKKLYVYTLHGKGTFVSPKHVEGMGGFASFTEKCALLGRTPRSVVVDYGLVDTPPSELFTKLQISKEELGDTGYLKLNRLRCMDDIPMMIETAYLPVKVFPGIEQVERAYFEHGSLYELINRRWHTTPFWADGVLAARLTTDEETKIFGYAAPIPAIVAWNITYSQEQRIIEFTQNVHGRDYVFEYPAVSE